MRVLVCVASKHGSTKEIAEAIGRQLTDAGLTVDVNDVAQVSDLAQYDAVVLGSAVYMGNWLESARQFATEHAGDLATRPTWLFSSGPTGDPPHPSADKAVSVDPIIAAIHVPLIVLAVHLHARNLRETSPIRDPVRRWNQEVDRCGR
jgi:menaquinone-dependent protoporphyrinogen oxidase